MRMKRNKIYVMNRSSLEITIKPIGIVKRVENAYASLDDLRSENVYIIIYEEYVNALYKIEENRLLWILWYSHMGGVSKNLIIHPRGDLKSEKVGLFSTRSPSRPNNIMLSLVKLIGRRDNILIVKGIDAYDKSPIIDIKPYSHSLDNPQKTLKL